jgi:hypothetical protein
MIGSIRIWRWVGFVLCAIIPVAVFYAPAPNSRLRSAIAIHDFGHVMAFGLLAAVLAFALSARSRLEFRSRVGATCLAGAAALVLGASVELAQETSGFGGDPWDVIRDGGGISFVALTLIALDPTMPARARAALVGLAIVILAVFAYPVLVALDDEARARALFPVLATFESKTELSRFHFGKGIRPKIIQTKDDKDRAVSAMRLRLPPGEYPGFELRYFPEDWRGMRALQVLIANPERTPIELTVRIDDVEYRLNLDDRYNQSFRVAPGVTRIKIPLTEVKKAPRDRKFDLGRVFSVLVFAVDLEQPHSIIIGPIALVH